MNANAIIWFIQYFSQSIIFLEVTPVHSFPSANILQDFQQLWVCEEHRHHFWHVCRTAELSLNNLQGIRSLPVKDYANATNLLGRTSPSVDRLFCLFAEEQGELIPQISFRYHTHFKSLFLLQLCRKPQCVKKPKVLSLLKSTKEQKSQF